MCRLRVKGADSLRVLQLPIRHGCALHHGDNLAGTWTVQHGERGPLSHLRLMDRMAPRILNAIIVSRYTIPAPFSQCRAFHTSPALFAPRQLAWRQRSLQELRLASLPRVDREAVRRRVEQLFDGGDEEQSRFDLSVFQSSEAAPLTRKQVPVVELSVDGIAAFVKQIGGCQSCAVYVPAREESDASLEVSSAVRPSHIVLDILHVGARRALLAALLQSYKPLVANRQIPVDGAASDEADWIIADLGIAFVHIFDPQTRAEIDFDGKLAAESLTRAPTSLDGFVGGFSESLPRLIASRSNFIDRYRRRQTERANK